MLFTMQYSAHSFLMRSLDNFSFNTKLLLRKKLKGGLSQNIKKNVLNLKGSIYRI